MNLIEATKLAGLAAALTSLPLAQRRPAYRPVAALLVFATISAALMPALEVPIREAQAIAPGAPLRGAMRVVGHIYQALFVAGTAAVAGLATWVFAQRRPWLVLVGYLSAIATLVFGYHALRGNDAQRLYLVVEMVALATSIAAIIRWTWRREAPTVAHTATLLIVVLECAAARSFNGPVFAQWGLAQVSNLVLYSFLVALHGGALWLTNSRRAY